MKAPRLDRWLENGAMDSKKKKALLKAFAAVEEDHLQKLIVLLAADPSLGKSHIHGVSGLNEGTTLLMRAVEYGSVESFMLLLPRCNVQAQDDLGRNALFVAMELGGSSQRIDALVDPLLLKSDLQATLRGKTAMMWATEQGRFELVARIERAMLQQELLASTSRAKASVSRNRRL